MKRSTRRKTVKSVDHVVIQLTEWLGIDETALAGLLGVSQKSLKDWRKCGIRDLPSKGCRLVRLHEAVSYLREQYREIPANKYKGLLENGRLVNDPADDEEGSTSLLNLIIEAPSSWTWSSGVDQAVKDELTSAFAAICERGQRRKSGK